MSARVVLGLLALMSGAGCVGEGRPLEEYLEDYERLHQSADAGPAPETPDAGAPPTPQCSSPGEGLALLRFVNVSATTTVRYFWVDTRCEERLYGTLAPGEEREQQTYGGHVWRVRDARDGALLRELRAEAGGEPVIVRVP